MHFIYEIFDKTIRDRPQDRYQSTTELLRAIDAVIERVQLKTHALNISLRQHCVFCGVGAYQFGSPSVNSLQDIRNNCGKYAGMLARCPALRGSATTCEEVDSSLPLSMPTDATPMFLHKKSSRSLPQSNYELGDLRHRIRRTPPIQRRAPAVGFKSP